MNASTASGSSVAMLRIASSRAPARSPACAWSAPQHVWAAGTSTSMPLRARTLAVAAFVPAKAARMTHPVNRATVPRFAPTAANRAGSGALDGAAFGTRSRSSASRFIPIARSTVRIPNRFER